MTRSDSFALEIIDTVVLSIISVVTISACTLLITFGLPQPEELVKEHMITMADSGRKQEMEPLLTPVCAHRHMHHPHH